MKNEKMPLEKALLHCLEDSDYTHKLIINVVNGKVDIDCDGAMPVIVFHALAIALDNGYTEGHIIECFSLAKEFNKSRIGK